MKKNNIKSINYAGQIINTESNEALPLDCPSRDMTDIKALPLDCPSRDMTDIKALPLDCPSRDMTDIKVLPLDCPSRDMTDIKALPLDCPSLNTSKINESIKKSRAIKGSMIAKLVFIGLFLLVTITLLIMKSNVAFCESVVRNFTFAWVGFWGRVFSVVPFSVFELCCAILVGVAIGLIAAIIYFLVRRKGRRALNHLLTITVIVVAILAVYTSTSTLAYNRQPLDLPRIENVNMTNENIVPSLQKYLDKKYATFDKIERNFKGEDGGSKCPYTFKELSAKISDEFEKLPPGYFPKYAPESKKITCSWLMSQFEIVGITFVPFGEGNINKCAPMIDQAYTIAHEMAHSVGVMREYEADELAIYILLTSDDTYLNYVGFSNSSMSETAHLSNNGDIYNKMYADLDEKFNITVTTADYNISKEFWHSNGLFRKVGEFFNNLYLKMQGQDDGTGSYDSPSVGTPSTGEDGEIVYKDVTYSQMQRMLFKMFE